MGKKFTTGSIIPLGDGLTGKSVLTNILLAKEWNTETIEEIHENIKKSLNIEMEFKSSTYTDGNGEVIKSSLQFYVFPGQRQRYKDIAPSFDEILQIFNFLPALDKVNVLLLLHDTTRLESLKSLESWLSVALMEGWITPDTSVCLVTNKIDLKKPDDKFLDDVSDGILTMIQDEIPEFQEQAFKSFKISCLTTEGLEELDDWISRWIALHGKVLSKN